MPLILHKNLQPQGELGLWQITESESWFGERLLLSSAEQQQLDRIKGRRRLEWLAARQLIHHMSGRPHRGAFFKDDFGKPHLEYSPFQISISHSGNLAAAIATLQPAGIDIQRMVGKIGRIAKRFMRPLELDSLQDSTRLEHLHVYWGAKEALYKAYGRRELDLCRHILIDPFPFDLQKGYCTGKILTDEFSADFQIWYEILDDYILVYAINKTLS